MIAPCACFVICYLFLTLELFSLDYRCYYFFIIRSRWTAPSGSKPAYAFQLTRAGKIHDDLWFRVTRGLHCSAENCTSSVLFWYPPRMRKGDVWRMRRLPSPQIRPLKRGHNGFHLRRKHKHECLRLSELKPAQAPEKETSWFKCAWAVFTMK